MDEYMVTLSAYDLSGQAQVDPDLYADALMDALVEHDGVVQSAAHGFELTMSIVASGPIEAANKAIGLLEKYRAGAPQIPGWPVLDVRAVLGVIADAEVAGPNAPDLVSGPEAAAILGVSKARVHQLAQEHRDFPKPLYQLAAGSLWTRQAIEAFNDGWERKPGRPRKASA